jgi:hypothetical protein
MKIKKSDIAELIKKVIIENGGEIELAQKISETVIRKINELDYRGAALTQGANYNADYQLNQNKDVNMNQRKLDKSNDLILPAINQAIGGNFGKLILRFYMQKMGLATMSVEFQFDKVLFIDNKKVILEGIIIEQTKFNPKQRKGKIEYNFKEGKFFEVNYYTNGKVERKFPMRIDTNTPNNEEITHKFLSFISNYLYSVEDYQTNVNNQNNK